MRLAYVVEANAYVPSGILRKARAQIRAWRARGHYVQAFLISPPPETPHDSPFIDDAVVLTQAWPFSTLGSVGLPSLRLWLNKWSSTRKLARHLEIFAPDVLYVRQTIWTPGYGRLLKRHVAVMELNSLDLMEVRHLHPIWRSIYRAGRGALLSSVAGVIAVSNEIQSSFSSEIRRYGLLSEVISNGMHGVRETPEPRNGTDQAPVLILVGSVGQPWHGVDKMVELARLMPTCRFICVGPDIDDPPPNLTSYPFTGIEELDRLYGESDIGLGSLALHRNRMAEASPLKVREYLARGLPVIGAYHDTDISGREFFLELDNEEDNIRPNLARIREFVARWKGRRVAPEDVEELRTEVKEEARLRFFQEVRGSRNGPR